MMKKSFMLVLALFFLLIMSGCGSRQSEQESNRLVLYTATAQETLDVILPAFTQATGIEVETITAGTGEIYARIQAERENPHADITWIGSYHAMLDPTLWHPYISPYNAYLPEAFRTTDGTINITHRVASVILYNTNLVDFEIRGYRCLLHPSLRGRIAHGDAARSASAYNHLENMLFALGDGDLFSDYAWDFVEEFLYHLDGRIIDSSGMIHRGVVDGEFAVGLTWDTPAQTYLAQGVEHVRVVLMEEGVVNAVSGLCIINGANNLENAKKFVDFLLSVEGQTLLGMEIDGTNPIRTDVPISDFKVSLADMVGIVSDPIEAAALRPYVVARYQDLYLRIFE